MGNVATELARGAQADHGVHVGAVDVHLAATVVDDGTDLADRFLEHAVGGRIGDHQRGQAFLVLAGLVAQVLDVDVAARVAGHHHHAHADHAGGSRVGTVGGGRDQTDVALAVAAALVVGTDRQQAGVLTLGAGVGLQRHGVVAGGGTEHRLQFVGELAVAFALLGRGERVQVAEFGPGHRDHLAGGIQLHGAGAQRDHRAVQRQVLVRQLAQVAHQLGFRVMAVEDRVAEDRRLAQQLDRQAVPAAGGKGGEVRSAWPSSASRPQRVSTSAWRTVSSSDRPRRPASISRRLIPAARAWHGSPRYARRWPGSGCRRNASARRPRPGAPGRRRGSRSAGGCAGRCAAGPAGRGRRRTCWRCWPAAAPGRCRCCWWPSRGGCAARGSAWPGGRPACRGGRWRRRPGVPACPA